MTNEKAISTIENAKNFAYDNVYEEAFDMAINALKEQKKGHWIETNDDSFIYRRIYKCSHCGDTVCDYPEDIQKYKYCSSCGAKMEKELKR
jgi:DNA-directed RNA polymerase subunit RPC12/RpoP